MGVKAIHDITGKIAVVSEANIEASPHLRVATSKEIQEADEARQIEVFGYVLATTPEPEAPEAPSSTWSKVNLLAYAANKKIDVDESLTKAEILKALTEGAE